MCTFGEDFVEFFSSISAYGPLLTKTKKDRKYQNFEKQNKQEQNGLEI